MTITDFLIAKYVKPMFPEWELTVDPLLFPLTFFVEVQPDLSIVSVEYA